MSIGTKEPDWNRISGLYPRTRSKRVYIHGPLSATLAEVRPDGTVIVKDALGRRGDLRRGHSFLIGSAEQPRFLDFRQVEQALLSPKVPILFSSYVDGDFRHRLTSLTAVGADGRMRIHQYLKVTNIHPTRSRTGHWFYQNAETSHDRFYEHANEDYVPFQSLAEPWHDGMPLTHAPLGAASGSLLHADGSTLLRYSADEASSVTYLSRAGEFNHILGFELTLAPGETKHIQVEIRDTFVGGQGQTEGNDTSPLPDEEAAIAAGRSMWDGYTADEVLVQVPEPVIQTIFDTARTNALQLIAARADGSALPGQGGFNDYTVVYTWEVSAYLRMLTRLGQADIVKRTLNYFLSTQENSVGPEGDIVSPEGSFRAYIFWMCETGAVLGLLADYYRVTKDREWLERHLSIVLKACEWVCRERAATKTLDETGGKVAHYGLLPQGRVHDWPDKGYFFFSDVTTWRGLSGMAAALGEIGHPEGSRYAREADDYRTCIRDAIERGTETDADGVRWMPNEAYTRSDVRTALYAWDGPVSFIDTGLIDAFDERIPEIEYKMRQKYAMSDLFAILLPEMEDPSLGALQERHAGAPIDLYYVNHSERIWHRTWSLRGEREKALRYFYSTMAFSTTLDTNHVHERFSPQLPWLSPWQPNGSGNGRIMEMILNTMYILEGNRLYLLPSAPAEWLEVGKSVRASRLGTVFGPLSLSVSRSAATKIEIDLALPSGIESLSVSLYLNDGYRIQAVESVDAQSGSPAWRVGVDERTMTLRDPGAGVKCAVRLVR
ncbi:hypothetical protein [Cohnella hashimotonis]|uniref:Alpha-L-rhamnosidase six-hairpin glycosidase domain-containing protein n=1 Tax=Cohnella hashimotonis TaxID=2826895 RepID=A0ABT6TL56_9BACL|nr:hypothetical protein [Cohnella hashimotonis]MDI4647465.1 hypothetical protein [Cohnella hashimotonis]